MIRLKKLTILLLMVPCLACSEQQSQNIKGKIITGKSGTYSFQSANLTFEVDAKNGGRVSAFKIDGKDFLSGKNINTDNWGSTFWTSPQSAWGWPPIGEIDNQEYTGGIKNDAVVLRSKKDPKFGYEIKKEFTASEADTSVIIRYTITNNSDSVRSVAPWEITRVSPGGLTFFPAGKGNKNGGLAPLMKDSIGITWYVYDANLVPAGNEKLICDGSEGWMAQVNNGVILIKKWDDVPLEKNAPGEGEVEIYANPDKSYIEIEPQGPYTILAPGASSAWEVKWYLRNLPPDIKAEAGNKNLVDFVRNTVKSK
jgi:Domain of unknown function (DUF4380)